MAVVSVAVRLGRVPATAPVGEIDLRDLVQGAVGLGQLPPDFLLRLDLALMAVFSDALASQIVGDLGRVPFRLPAYLFPFQFPVGPEVDVVADIRFALVPPLF